MYIFSKGGFLVGIISILLLVAVFFYAGKVRPPLKGEEMGNPEAASPARTSDFSLDSLSTPLWGLEQVAGQPLEAESLKEQVVLLDFWATWCKPCQAMVPHLSALQTSYEEQGFQVLGICLDEGNPGTIRPTIERWGIDYPVLMGDEEVAEAFGGIAMIPTTFLINREGEVTGRFVGVVGRETLERAVCRELFPASKMP